MVSCERMTGVVEGTIHHPLQGIMSCRRRGACGRCDSAQMMSEVGPWCASKLRLLPEVRPVRSDETRPSRGRGTVRSGQPVNSAEHYSLGRILYINLLEWHQRRLAWYVISSRVDFCRSIFMQP